MTERERLIEMIDNSNACICVDGDKLTDYLLQNGVIVLPCNVGDTVYRLNIVTVPDDEYRVSFHREMYIEETTFDITLYCEIGKMVFITREEAETKLKNLQGMDI